MFILVSQWRLFKKMGYKGWTCLIPFYSDFCRIEALYGNGWLMFLPVLIVFGGIILILLFSGAISDFQSKLTFLIVGNVLIFIAVLVLIIKYIFDFIHAFNKFGWWTAGMLFFYPIMNIVFGISDFTFKDNYYPNPENYDAIDGFIYFFRNQGPFNKKEIVRHCKECGAVLRENTIFCSKCGTKND